MPRLPFLPFAVIIAGCAIARPAAAQRERLFDSSAPLDVRVVTDLGALMKERDSTKLQPHPGTFSYAGGDGKTVSLPAEFKLRGHWRRQRKNCDFAPIKVDFPKDARNGTLFEDQGDLKLVTHCKTGSAEYEQYVLREYSVYQLANIVSAINLRARLLRVTYVDTAGKVDSITRSAFFIENEKRAAARNNAKVLDAKGVLFEEIDAHATSVASAFLYMIGGSDWSLAGLHNIVLFQQQGADTIRMMPYDFDWTGIVNTRYAVPDSRLQIRTVRTRLYRGICRTPEQWAPILASFQEKKAALYAVYDSIPGLDPKYVAETRKYLDEFFEVISDPRKVKREMIETCKQGT